MKPYQILVFIGCCLIGLATLCVVLPNRIALGEYTLRLPSLAEILELQGQSDLSESSDFSELSEPSESSEFLTFTDTISENTVATQAKQTPVTVPLVKVDSTTDSRIFLATFYMSLRESHGHKVRVVHYGDSQIEEDRMTQQIRKALQSRYGGAGVGLVPLVQTIPSRAVHQEIHMGGKKVTAQQGPRRYMVHGPKRIQRSDGLYGPMGQMAVMNDSLVKGSEELMIVVEPLDDGPRYSRMNVFADSAILYSIVGDTVRLWGRGNVYGISQETDTGVIVDNIPMRGCLGLVFNKIDSAQLRNFYQSENVSLIIMQFGGNAIPFNETPSTVAAIVKGLRRQVRYLRECAPEADILFIGPSDMLTLRDGTEQTYPMVPYMDRLLRKMALEENIAYFSLYKWMGGSGSMAHWKEIGLAGADGIHFTRIGARKAGKAVAEWLLEGEELVADDENKESEGEE